MIFMLLYRSEKHAKEMMSHMSLFTTDSYDFYEQGEESPFHDRVSSKLVGRTLVVGLVKVVEAQELKSRKLFLHINDIDLNSL